MRPSDIKRLIVTLLSSARNPDVPSHCLGLTCRQICNHIESLLPPDQDSGVAKGLMKRVGEQLEILESEFEVASRGEGRRTYRMAPTILIIERETPLRARYVGDRAYFNAVVELLGAECDKETWLLETAKTAEESRDILEARGISLQTEEMLFQFLPDPVLPSEIDLSMAEQLAKDGIGADIEVYIPRRIDFFANRWIRVEKALPSDMSQLRRVKMKSFRSGRFEPVYFWEAAGRLYRLSKNQAMLAMYRIDIDRNEVRLLNLGSVIPISIRKKVPSAYQALVDRYTERVAGSEAKGDKNDNRSEYVQVKYKYKELFARLLETKLGINKPLT